MGDKKTIPVVGVLNLKGGVGKTTVSAHVMDILTQQAGLTTLLVDLDPQFNLTQTIMDRADYDLLKADNRTIMSVMEDPPSTDLFQINQSSVQPPTPAEIAVNMFYLTGQPDIRLDLIAGDFDIVKYSLIDDASQLARVRTRFHNFIDKAKSSYDLICIDCNPSSSFLTQCVIHEVSHIIAPVRPDRYSVLGLELLDQYIERFPTIDPKPTLSVVLNGVKRTSGASDVEQELRSHGRFGSRTLATRLYDSRILEARAAQVGFAADRRVPHGGSLRLVLSKISSELRPILGV